MRKVYWSYTKNDTGDRVKVHLPGSGNETLVMPTLTSMWEGCDSKNKRVAEVLTIEDSPKQKRTCPEDRGVGFKGRQALADNVCRVVEQLRGPQGEALPEHRRATFLQLLEAAVLDVLDDNFPSKDIALIRRVVRDASAALELR